MGGFKVVLASGAEHLREGFLEAGYRVFSNTPNFDGKRFFPNSDLFVKIAEVEELSDQRVVVVQSCTGSSPSEDEYFTTSDRLEELVLMLDLLRQPVRVEKTGHKEYTTTSIEPPSSIEVVLTFQPFALQDKTFSTGEAVSSRSAMRSIARRCDSLWVMEPVVNKGIDWVKELAEQGKYEIISFTQDMIQMAGHIFGFDEYVLTAPDEGAQKRFGVPGFSKRRSDSYTIDMKGELDVAGKNVIVLDDLTKSGTTLLEASSLLHEQGAADVGFLVLHVMPVREVGERLLRELIEKSNGKVVTSNTVYSAAFCDEHPGLVYDVVRRIVDSLKT